ncbi:MAG TPA: RsmG family class I SAM-dependent methyltransferase, partial [Chloroflexota bacterium]|nr:RsmG family class I SAM-dependent methyltransferase [Chloroflexota bacterium]
TGKKVAWLNRTAALLGLSGLVAIAERAETLARAPEHRQSYDVATARAVAPLAVLCELCLPFVRRGGRFIALKTGTGAEAELPQAERALRTLGGVISSVTPVHVSGLPNRVLVEIEQRGAVPSQYPRRPGMPNKRPL